MYDLNYILTGKKVKQKKTDFLNLFNSKKNNKPINNNLMKSFLGQGHPNPRDKLTRPQSMFLKRTKYGTGKSHQRFWDHDKDNVISGLDCSPMNKRKHMALGDNDALIKRTVTEVGEVDNQGMCLGNCKKISFVLNKKMPESKVIKSSPNVDIGAEHRAVLTKDGTIIDTQAWQFKERQPTDLNTRKVEFTRDEYEKDFTIGDEDNDIEKNDLQ